ncbi:hypothetical protein E4U31_003554 [Claviceps sp. LM219 group G6]|nr:hypothetical protein E4U31_003554 [Claviceps sp. LM219 group G6]
MASNSSEATGSAVETRINPATGKPNLSRYTEHNLEKQTNRQEAQEKEERRIRKVRIEVGFLRRWLRAVRGTVRASLKEMTLGQLMCQRRKGILEPV